MSIRTITAAAVVCLACTAAFAAELAEVRVSPPAISLTTSRARQSVVVQAVYADGITRDVTDQATYTFANEGLIRREGNLLYPVADGETQLTVAFETKSVTVPAKIQRAAEPRPVSVACAASQNEVESCA